jgi:hypothetical protein
VRQTIKAAETLKHVKQPSIAMQKSKKKKKSVLAQKLLQLQETSKLYEIVKMVIVGPQKRSSAENILKLFKIIFFFSEMLLKILKGKKNSNGEFLSLFLTIH